MKKVGNPARTASCTSTTASIASIKTRCTFEVHNEHYFPEMKPWGDFLQRSRCNFPEFFPFFLFPPLQSLFTYSAHLFIENPISFAYSNRLRFAGKLTFQQLRVKFVFKVNRSFLIPFQGWSHFWVVLVQKTNCILEEKKSLYFPCFFHFSFSSCDNS